MNTDPMETPQEIQEAPAQETPVQQALVQEEHHHGGPRGMLMAQNAAVLVAVILFAISLFPGHNTHLIKAVAYFFGAVAYFCELMYHTNCFRNKIPRSESFMAFCFGPMYILLGISYIFHH